MSEVFWQILSPLALTDREDARRIFELWALCAPETLPDRYGSTEPIKKEFSMAALDEVIRIWELYIHFKRVRTPKYISSVFMHHGLHRKHSIWNISFKQNDGALQSSLTNMLSLAVNEFNCDFAFIHCPVDDDVDRGRAAGPFIFLDPAKKRKNLFVTTHDLVKYIPDVYWITVFGPPYVRLFGRDRLLSTPAFRVEELADGSVLIQATSSLHDLSANPAPFVKARIAIKQHLDHNAFFDLGLGVGHKYDVPEFIWKPLS